MRAIGTVKNDKISISRPISGIVVLTILCAAFTNNGLYLVCCLLALYSILALLWRKNRPGILVFAFLFQWIQVVAFVIWMDVVGFDINKTSPHGGIAVIMACIGIVAMAGVLAQSVRPLPIPTLDQFYQQARLIDEKKIFLLYLFSTIFLGGIGFVLGARSGFAQILLTLASVKWVFFLVFAYVSWINKKNRMLLLAVIVFEFVTSLYSYFSSFKEIFLYTIILALTFIQKISFKQVMYSLFTTVFMVFLLITWTAIKGDYRDYLNGGTRQQVVNVSRTEAFDKIREKVGSLTWEDYQHAMILSLYRVQYIYHLAKAMDRVPSVLPYEFGKVWWDNITFVLEPRLFFPDKPLYEATKKTIKYTGIHYAGFKQGASFSLGYFADSFVDFGYIGMILPLICIALYVGWMYRSFYKLKINLLFRYALINVALYEYSSFEADGLFLCGRLLVMFLVFWAIGKWILPLIQKWLYKPRLR